MAPCDDVTQLAAWCFQVTFRTQSWHQETEVRLAWSQNLTWIGQVWTYNIFLGRKFHYPWWLHWNEAPTCTWEHPIYQLLRIASSAPSAVFQFQNLRKLGSTDNAIVQLVINRCHVRFQCGFSSWVRKSDSLTHSWIHHSTQQTTVLSLQGSGRCPQSPHTHAVVESGHHHTLNLSPKMNSMNPPLAISWLQKVVWEKVGLNVLGIW